MKALVSVKRVVDSNVKVRGLEADLFTAVLELQALL